MKDLQKIYTQCKKDIEAAGIKLGPITSCTVNTKIRKTLGRCTLHHNTNTFTIEISSRVLNDNISEKTTKSTVYHEILHAMKDGKGMSHTNAWDTAARKVSKMYGVNISRCAGDEEQRDLNNFSPVSYKYIIHCTNPECRCEWKRIKRSNIVDHPEQYRCHCGGELKVIEN